MILNVSQTSLGQIYN